MKLENISANFLGDSITEGCGVSDPENKVFHQLLAKKFAMKTARNYGISATRIARQKFHREGQPEREDLDFCLRFSEMDDDAQLIVVFGGTNDFGHGNAPFGNFEDRDPSTFCGACHYMMSGLIEKYPTSRIVIMTPLHRITEDNPNVTTGKTLIDYVNVIKETAKFYSLPVIDLWANSGIQPRVDAIKNIYCPDGLHPNDAGHEKLANYIGNCLENL